MSTPLTWDIKGNDGVQGAPGAVSKQQLAEAFAGTCNKSNGMSTLGQDADGYYNQNQMQDVLHKLDELINALRR